MSTISSLLPLFSSTTPQSIDPQSLIEEAAAAAQAQQAAQSTQSAELSANQNHVTGLNQLLSAMTAFDASLQAVQQQADGGNPANVAAAAQQFVDAYNNLVSTLSKLSASGGALAGDGIVNDIENSLNQAIGSVTNNSLGGLSAIGINQNADGTLSLDAAALQQANGADSADTVSLLNQASQALDNVANGFAQPGGAIAAESDTLIAQQPMLEARNNASNQSTAVAEKAVADYEAMMKASMKSELMSGLAQQLFGTADASSGDPLALFPSLGGSDSSAALSALLGNPAAANGGSSTAPAGSGVSLLA